MDLGIDQYEIPSTTPDSLPSHDLILCNDFKRPIRWCSGGIVEEKYKTQELTQWIGIGSTQYQSKVLGTKMVGAPPQVEITWQEPMTSNDQYRMIFKHIIVVLFQLYFKWPTQFNIETSHSYVPIIHTLSKPYPTCAISERLMTQVQTTFNQK